MEDLLIQILSSFGFPVRRQGSFLEDEPYPNDFFTFWNSIADGEAFYDNTDHSTEYEYDVNFYSVDPDKPYEILREAKNILRKNNFEVWGDAHDVMSDEPTHVGRGFTVSILKTNEEE